MRYIPPLKADSVRHCDVGLPRFARNDDADFIEPQGPTLEPVPSLSLGRDKGYPSTAEGSG